MTPKDPPFVAQVILERGFRTQEEAEIWADQARHGLSPDGRSLSPDHSESRLWEPVSPIGAREVDG